MDHTLASVRYRMYSLRARRLRLLIDERFGRDCSRLAEQLGWSPDLIERFFVSGRPRCRYITDRAAREIEKKIGLAEFWLDGEPAPERSKRTAPVQSEPPV